MGKHDIGKSERMRLIWSMDRFRTMNAVEGATSFARTIEPRNRWKQQIRDYVALTKPRIMLLLLFTAYCAMILARQGVPSINSSVWAMIGLGLSCGGAATLNMWYDRDIDRMMVRTADRPIPQGRIHPLRALLFGLCLEVLSLAILMYRVNEWAALLTFGGFFYYVVIYTMWLKRRTPHNIVIGGGAGAFPPLVGWAAVTGHVTWTPIIMFLIIFFWTPPHFWALALYKQEEFHNAKIPMMPNARGIRTTKIQSLVYTIILVVFSLVLYLTGRVGLIYVAIAAILGGGFLYYVIRQLVARRDDAANTRQTFRFSLVYLALLFLVMIFNVR